MDNDGGVFTERGLSRTLHLAQDGPSSSPEQRSWMFNPPVLIPGAPDPRTDGRRDGRTDVIVPEAQALWWPKAEPENKADPCARLTRASAHVRSHPGGPSNSHDSGAPLTGPGEPSTSSRPLRELLQVSHSSGVLISSLSRTFSGEEPETGPSRNQDRIPELGRVRPEPARFGWRACPGF